MEELEVFSHMTPVQIRFNDVDILGHVNNAVHQYYFDYARLQYFRDVFGRSVDWKKEGMVLVNITVDYFDPVRLDDSIEVHTRVSRIGNKSLGMSQRIVDTKTGVIKSRNRSVLVAYDLVQQKTMEVPANWKKHIAYFDQVSI